MLAALSGAVATLDARDVARLRQRSVRADELPPDATSIGVAHLTADESCSDTAFYQHDDQFFASAEGQVIRLNRVAAARLLRPLFREPNAVPTRPGARTLAAGVDGVLDPAYTQSEIELTREEVNDRLNHRTSGVRFDTDGVKRSLRNERFRIRVPRTLSPDRPAPLMVWISPTPRGTLPQAFFPVLDELRMVAVGIDNAGNERRPIDRMQLVFDAIETAATRVPIDRARVYLAGFSGGGRVSSILLHTYPDVFAGAVPIVGLNSYHSVDFDNGRYLPGLYPRPRGDRLVEARSRRLFAITGSLDFNRDEMLRRQRLLADDGFPARIEVVEGMPHEQMPPPEVIAEALRWVDEPQRSARDDADDRAADLLAQAEAAAASPALRTQRKTRELLLEATRVGPWSPAAWRAAEWLVGGMPERVTAPADAD